MISHKTLVALGVIIAALSLMITILGIFPPPENPIVSIISPSENEPVSRSITVSGTQSGDLPKGHYVWIMVNPTWGSGQWWPQYGSPIQPVNDKWSVTAVVGNDSNSGKEFNIAAVQVDSIGNSAIDNWVISAPELGYPSMSLPDNAKIMDAVRVKRL
ncbi:MAG: hypothetical protein JW999_11575 [Methanotrichaceae archaeon]|nr:hypothetical protein [Methanotrichaceae archaeon]